MSAALVPALTAADETLLDPINVSGEVENQHGPVALSGETLEDLATPPPPRGMSDLFAGELEQSNYSLAFKNENATGGFSPEIHLGFSSSFLEQGDPVDPSNTRPLRGGEVETWNGKIQNGFLFGNHSLTAGIGFFQEGTGGTAEAALSLDLANATLPGYEVANLFAECNPARVQGLTVHAEINNLFDSYYISRARQGSDNGRVLTYGEPGRSLAGTAR